jgi:hypothetical protein
VFGPRLFQHSLMFEDEVSAYLSEASVRRSALGQASVHTHKLEIIVGQNENSENPEVFYIIGPCRRWS